VTRKLIINGGAVSQHDDVHIGVAPHIFGKYQTALVGKPDIKYRHHIGFRKEMLIKLIR